VSQLPPLIPTEQFKSAVSGMGCDPGSIHQITITKKQIMPDIMMTLAWKMKTNGGKSRTGHFDLRPAELPSYVMRKGFHGYLRDG